MSKRPAAVTQADIARAIRAMKAEGFPNVRVVLRAECVVVEPVGGRYDGGAESLDDDPEEIVIL